MISSPKTTEWLRSTGLKVGDKLNTNWYNYNRKLAAIAQRNGWLSNSSVLVQTGPALIILVMP